MHAYHLALLHAAARQDSAMRRHWLYGCALMLAAAWVPSGAFAQTRPEASAIERLNQEYGSPPRIEAEQLRAGPAAPAAITPATVDAPYIRALELLAMQADSGAKPALPEARTPRDAAWLLGLLNLHGVGTGLNPARAREWFERAQQLRHPLAPAGLAWCLLDGCGQQPRPEQATPWIAQLQKTDAGRAYYLEWIRNQKLAPLEIATPQNPLHSDAPRQPSALVLRSAKAKDPGGENELGIFYAEAGRLGDAERLFTSAAPRSPAAQANLQWLARARDEKREAAPIEASRKNSEQLFLRARQFHRGDGVPVNYGEALRLYKQAASQGNAHAQKMLGLIYTRPTPTGDINIVWMQQLANIDVTSEGSGTLLEPPPSPLLQRDPTPLYNYLPMRLRAG